MAYHVAVQSSDASYGAQMDTQQPVYPTSCHSEPNENGGTSAVVDGNGRAHNVYRITTSSSPRNSLYNHINTPNDLNFPNSSDTFVLSESMMNDNFYGALENSTQALSLDLHGEPRNNQISANMYTPSTPSALMTPEDYLIQQLSGISDLDPMLFDTSSEALSHSFDQSSANSGFSPYAVFDQSSMVTGLGGHFENRPSNLPLGGGTVFNEQPSVLVRKTDTIVPPTPDSVPMKYSLFNADFTVASDYQEAAVEEHMLPGKVTVQATEESKPKKDSIGDDLNLIRMLSSKRRMTPHLESFVAPEHLVPASQLSPNPLMPKTPDYAPSPSPSLVSDNSLSPMPSTPGTPATTTQQGPFSLRCFSEKNARCFELAICEDLTRANKVVALKALFYCFEMCNKFSESLKCPVDLKVANDTTAKLCEFNFDSISHKLVTKVPKDCVPLDKFLETHVDRLDLRVRQLLLQQVLNALANIHTGCAEDRMSLWGSFLVWVGKDMSVHLLLDFPVMLAKMEQSCSMAGFDPRLEDMTAVYKMYLDMFKPFICSNSTWSSPGLQKLLGKRFELILTSPNCGSRMAEVARNFGERRMCKIEVDMLSIDTLIYCLEHETLSSALSPLENVIPPGVSPTWELYHSQTGRLVGKEDTAIAGNVMRFMLHPLYSIPSPYNEALLIISKY